MTERTTPPPPAAVLEPQVDSLAEAVLAKLEVGVEVLDLSGQSVAENSAAVALRARAQAGDTAVRIGCKPVTWAGRHFTMQTLVDYGDYDQREQELTQRAYIDDLTGVPNRAMLQYSIDHIIHKADAAERFAFAFIDLDNFKQINDYYSHTAGDAVLVEICRRINACIAPTDMLARISGDEFVLIVRPIIGDVVLQERIETVLAELKRPFYFDGFEILPSASIGVSIYPDHGSNYEVLRRNADNAMYRAKHGNKGTALFYDHETGRAVAEKIRLEQRLRAAIQDGNFCCAFQPKVDIRSEQVIGVEALIRWRDEVGDIAAPSTFIGLATELGLIDSITTLVVSECVRLIDRIDDVFGEYASISINVAAQQAADIPFMRSLLAHMKETGFAHRFMVEVTEGAFFEKSPFQSRVLPLMREAGVRVSIDDFGTGYSSLSSLADIAVDEVKIDRSFITAIHQRPRSQIVLKTIESLGQALGMTIIAEGVETFEELAFLQAATGIRYAQGYYFSRPMFLDGRRGSVATDRPRAMAPERGTAGQRGQSITRFASR